MTAYHKTAKKAKVTPQTEPVPGRESEMIQNNAGGYAFQLSAMGQFQRFLILGSEGNTYYCTEAKMTEDNTKNVRKLFDSIQGVEAVQLLAKISDEGRAPKVSPALYALALAFTSKNLDTKKAARIAFGTVVRTHSHMLEFVSYVDELRGWGRMLRETVAHWYNSMDTNQLGYQLAKYRNRSGWTTRDVLRMAHPKAEDTGRNALYKWAVGKHDEADMIDLPNIVASHILAMSAEDGLSDLVKASYIKTNGLTREMIPNTWLNSPTVWEAMLQSMPMTAMIRNLGKMSEVGLLKDFSNASKLVVDRLHDVEYLKRSRIHPLNVLVAYYTYMQGKGMRGSLSWTPVSTINDALEDAFYASFANVEPTGKNTLIALDVSGSMGWGNIAGTPLMPVDVTAALGLVTARTEPSYKIVGFCEKVVDLGITAVDSLATARLKALKNNFGGTDVGAAINYAAKNNLPVENFLVVTDNETWCGNKHVFQSLRDYRRSSGINAKVAFMALTATHVSLADPNDAGMLDIVGFDSSAPQILGDFFR